jgi:hypothetical protein
MVLFNDSIYYNIAYGNLGASREAVEAAAKAAQVRVGLGTGALSIAGQYSWIVWPGLGTSV